MTRRFLLLFLPTFVFLTFFSGFYLYLYIYYLQSSHESYEWFAFRGDYQPSQTEILLSGFRDLQAVVANLIISGIFALLGGVFLQSSRIKNRRLKTVYNGILLSLFLGGLFVIYYLFQLIGKQYYTRSEATRAILILTASYTTVGLLLTHLFYRKNNREPKAATHSTQQ